MVVADYHSITNIPVIRNRGGNLVSEPQTILKEIIDFLSALYSPITLYEGSALDSLLVGLSLARLSEEDSNALDAKITTKEIELKLQSLLSPPHKVPGLDSVPADFYQTTVSPQTWITSGLLPCK